MESDEKLFGNATEFAKYRGISQGYVSTLRKKGYLVFTHDGLIDFKASDRRLAAMIDPNRAVGQRARRLTLPSGLGDEPAIDQAIGRVLADSLDECLVPAAAMVSRHLGITPSAALEVVELVVLRMWAAVDGQLGDELAIPARGAFGALLSDRAGLVRLVAALSSQLGPLRVGG